MRNGRKKEEIKAGEDQAFTKLISDNNRASGQYSAPGSQSKPYFALSLAAQCTIIILSIPIHKRTILGQKDPGLTFASRLPDNCLAQVRVTTF